MTVSDRIKAESEPKEKAMCAIVTHERHRQYAVSQGDGNWAGNFSLMQLVEVIAVHFLLGPQSNSLGPLDVTAL